MEKWNQDAANYFEMNKPFETPEKANDAIATFHEKISALRKELNISDILYVIKDSAIYPDGKVGEFLIQMQIGSQLNGPSMAAFACGQVEAENRELINKLKAGQLH